MWPKVKTGGGIRGPVEVLRECEKDDGLYPLLSTAFESRYRYPADWSLKQIVVNELYGAIRRMPQAPEPKRRLPGNGCGGCRCTRTFETKGIVNVDFHASCLSRICCPLR